MTYKQVAADEVAIIRYGKGDVADPETEVGDFEPVATLADEYGGRCQIAIDDHCYVLYLKREDGTYKLTSHIFYEAFEVLKKLPPPD